MQLLFISCIETLYKNAEKAAFNHIFMVNDKQTKKRNRIGKLWRGHSHPLTFESMNRIECTPLYVLRTRQKKVIERRDVEGRMQ